jgi:hypothetical protein
MSPTYNIGGVHMTIEALLLILILTLGVACVLNRLDAGRDVFGGGKGRRGRA